MPKVADIVARVKHAVVRVETPGGGTGSGFVIDASGYILTNEHVVTTHASVDVQFANGVRRTASVVATDAAKDIALLKFTPATAPTVFSFASSVVQQGDQVIALGYPLGKLLGADMTVTMGVVSAFRTIQNVSFIQTDASLNPGNSGGPLLNMKGEVVGMNTAGIDEAPDGRPVEGISFAIRHSALSAQLPVLMAAPAPTPRPPTPVPTPIATPKPPPTISPIPTPRPTLPPTPKPGKTSFTASEIMRYIDGHLDFMYDFRPIRLTWEREPEDSWQGSRGIDWVGTAFDSGIYVALQGDLIVKGAYVVDVTHMIIGDGEVQLELALLLALGIPSEELSKVERVDTDFSRPIKEVQVGPVHIYGRFSMYFIRWLDADTGIPTGSIFNVMW